MNSIWKDILKFSLSDKTWVVTLLVEELKYIKSEAEKNSFLIKKSLCFEYDIIKLLSKVDMGDIKNYFSILSLSRCLTFYDLSYT